MASGDLPPTPSLALSEAAATEFAAEPEHSPEAAPSGVGLPASDEPAAGPPVRTALDGALVFGVLVLAFLLGSAPARNSDVWLHLATGRALADGTWRFGPDPFSYTAADDPWIVHSWLWDLVSYGLFRLLGGAALIVVRALVVAVLAAVLVRLGATGGRLALSAACAALAVLALGVRLPLQSICVSYLFLGLTLLLLERGTRRAQDGTGWLRNYGPLPALFALWVNLDGWFFLGPLTVGLYLLGEALRVRRRTPDLVGLAMALSAGLAACLVNPWAVRAFTLPPELAFSGAAAAFRHDPSLTTLSLSPFQPGYLSPNVGLNAAGLAFFLLALASLASFALSPEGRRSWRLPVWLAFFVLAAWSARAVPFFAVVAGPILARNVQDFAARREGVFAGMRPGWAEAGRGTALLAVLGLTVAAWPGWLQGTPHERRLWTVSADPSVERAAKEVARWRQEGRLAPDARGFHFSLDTANYFAWFCPAEKSWADASLQAPAADAADYVAVRRALLNPAVPAGPFRWQPALRSRHVDHVILHDFNYDRLLSTYNGLWQTPEARWDLLLIEGHTIILGWQDPERDGKGNPFAGRLLDLDRLAFHPPADKQAPPQWPGRDTRPVEWWDALVYPRILRAPDCDEARLYLQHFDLEVQPTRGKGAFLWVNAVAAAGVGCAASGTLASSLGLWGQVELFSPDVGTPHLQNYLRQGDDGPPGLAFLAVRAARRALQVNPDDPQALLVLGEAYLRLLLHTRERVWARPLPRLTHLRAVQASAAFNQALLRQPDLLSAHTGLVKVYQHLGYKDLTLKHLEEVLRLSRERGPSPGETPDQAGTRLDFLAETVRLLEKEVTQLRDLHEINSEYLTVSPKAKRALERGLAGKALETLLAEPDLVGAGNKDGVQLELSLLLATGRLREVREWLSPGHQELLGHEEYHWVRAQLEAASGNYDAADAALQAAAPSGETAFAGFGLVPVRIDMARLIGMVVLAGGREGESSLARVYPRMIQGVYLDDLNLLSSFLVLQANGAVLRGLIALEAGNTARAAEHLRGALGLWGNDAAAAAGAGLDFDGRPAAQRLLDLLSAAH